MVGSGTRKHRRTLIAIALAIVCIGPFASEPSASTASRWSVVASPNPAGVTSSNLDAVSCATATSCFAVGYSTAGPNTHAFIERWDGTRWSLVTSPSRARTSSSMLTGVSCPSATFCFAVGHTEGSDAQSLVERWDGKHWALQNSNAFPTHPENWLNGVSCTSPTFCMAVGTTVNATGDEDDAFAARWDGHSWTVSADQNPNGLLNWLHAVSCVSPTNCTAVGEVNNNYPTLPLVGHWNGKHWKIAQLPSKTDDMLLESVACPTATACLALGSRNYQAPLAERWGTGGWKTTPAPSTAGSVVCTSATSCLEAGGGDIEHWNGRSWSTVLTLAVRLDGITCKGTMCIAVGAKDTKAGSRTLVVQSG